MNTTMSKSAPSTIDLDPPGGLLSTLSLGGYQARILVSREDGAPMTEADRKEAALLIEESEQRGLSDAEIDRKATAYEKQPAAPASRTKRAAPATKPKATKKRAPKAAE